MNTNRKSEESHNETRKTKLRIPNNITYIRSFVLRSAGIADSIDARRVDSRGVFTIFTITFFFLSFLSRINHLFNVLFFFFFISSRLTRINQTKRTRVRVSCVCVCSGIWGPCEMALVCYSCTKIKMFTTTFVR